MSKPGPRRVATKSSTRNQPPPSDDTMDRSTAPPTTNRTDMDNKDDASSNGDKKDIKSGDEATTTTVVAPKPQSAGATIRDAGQKLLSLTMKQEWTSIDPVLKQLEKIVAAGNAETNTTPLAGVMDPVSMTNVNFLELIISPTKECKTKTKFRTKIRINSLGSCGE